MSTRSGKRIHGSFLETTNNAENKAIVKGEKKARSKRSKENYHDTAMKTKKRNNYVSFPTSLSSEPLHDNSIAAEKNAGETLLVNHKVTVKERNLDVSLNIGEDSLDSKTVTRQTRRGKRSAENHTEENGIIEKLPLKKNKSKKGKNKKAKSTPNVVNDTKEEQVEIPKKSKKKKVKTDVKNINPNKSNGSVDSFHSAAESPEPLQKVETPQETLRKSPHRSCKRSKPDDNNDCDILNATNPKRSKKSRLSNHSVNISIEETNQSQRSKHSNVSENNYGANTESNGVDQQIMDITFEKEPRPKRKSNFNNNTFDKTGTPLNKLNSTYEKTNTPDKLNVTYDRENELKKSLGQSTIEKPVRLNSTFNKSNESGQLILNSTFDKETRLDPTSGNTESDNKSLISSNGTVNLTFDKSNNSSKISITSDDSHINNIVNTTPVLIESSMDESRERDSSPIPDKKTDTSDDILNVSLAPQTPVKKLVVVLTPLKREGTFTKEGPEVMTMSPKPKLSSERTPVKRMSLPSAGYTPFHVSRSSNKEKSILNLTHSIEKAGRRSSLVEAAPRMTRVMFCSPVNNPAVVMQQKRKVIKSNLKGSNKSFVFDESVQSSKISITSDDSHINNIVNTTPVLIESSMDESRERDSSPIPDKKTDTSDDILNVSLAPQTPVKKLVVVLTPLKREGTFTKEGPEVMTMSPKPKLSSERTPVKRMSLPSAGYTPFHVSRSSNKEKSILNLTHSIEKAGRRSSLVEAAPRMTRVMFCSPVNNPAVVMQQKRKVIKSNLKGSNKSFVFDESATEAGPAVPRKRSYTHNDADAARGKRTRLADGLQTSVDRLSRPRTASVTVKLPEPSTPSKKPLSTKSPTPCKASSEAQRARTKLPNFAALHQRQFERMESLDECQRRRARRARLLRTPSGGLSVLDRTSPTLRVSTASPAKPARKTDTPTKAPKAAPAPRPPLAQIPNLPTLESLRPGYTRFGFRMHTDANPFSVPATAKPKEIKPNGLVKRQHTLPSLKRTTSQRKEVAKQTVMREKSFTSLSDKRNVKRAETRTTIKGVRTNRRFELQMMLRNINA